MIVYHGGIDIIEKPNTTFSTKYLNYKYLVEDLLENEKELFM